MDKKREYIERTYRSRHEAGDMKYFNIKVKESDLAIGVDLPAYSDSLMSLCRKELQSIRAELEDYIKIHPQFLTSLTPLELSPGAPGLVKKMAQAARAAGVGPMAAVAGTVSQAMGEILKKRCREYIVENGGDIYLYTLHQRNVAVFAGTSPFTYRIGVRIEPEEGALGICTSSGTVGPSLSFGKADAVVIKAADAALADAVATGAANLVRDEKDLIKAVDYVKNISGVAGILAIKNDKLAAWGNMKLEPLT